MIRPLIAALAVFAIAGSISAYAADEHAAKTKDAHAAAPASHGEASHGADAGHGGEGGHGTPNLLPMSSGEIVEKAPLAIWSFVVFMVLLALATKFGWKPIVNAMHDREHHMEAVLHDTEKARNEAEGLLRQYKSEMASASDKIKALLDEARRDATHTAQEIVSKAQSESEALKQRAERDINQARDEALIDIWSKAADMSVQVAGKVLQKSLSADDQKRLVELSTAELPARGAFGISETTGSQR